MNIDVTKTIQAPIAAVWQVLADDFAGIQGWFPDVKKSYPIPGVEAPAGCPINGRVCEFTDDPSGLRAVEKILHYDAAAHELEFEVVPENAPAMLPLKKNTIRAKLEAIDAGTTKLTWSADADLKPHGYLMYPMLKIGVGKQFANLLDAMAVHIEKRAARAA